MHFFVFCTRYLFYFFFKPLVVLFCVFFVLFISHVSYFVLVFRFFLFFFPCAYVVVPGFVVAVSAAVLAVVIKRVVLTRLLYRCSCSGRDNCFVVLLLLTRLLPPLPLL